MFLDTSVMSNIMLYISFIYNNDTNLLKIYWISLTYMSVTIINSEFLKRCKTSSLLEKRGKLITDERKSNHTLKLSIPLSPGNPLNPGTPSCPGKESPGVPGNPRKPSLPGNPGYP